MINYVFSPTGLSVYLEVAKRLSINSIASPVIWLGDPIHKLGVQDIWRDVYVDLDELRFFGSDSLSTFENNEVSIELTSYITSFEYFSCKDICLKMMDRVDIYFEFSRTDRELVFNAVLFKLFNLIEQRNPDVFLFVEAPHSFVQYILFSISRFKGIPAFNFDSLNTLPLLLLRNSHDQERFVLKENILDKVQNDIVELSLKNFLRDFTKKELVYMKNQNKKSYGLLIKRKFNLIKSEFKNLYFYLKDNPFVYKPHNPLFISPIVLQRKINKRIKLLQLSASKCSVDQDLPEFFIYFPLHKEPERTTNPDGGIQFHDQLKVIFCLSNLFPNLTVLVKEHPSQLNPRLNHIEKGRSPLFYLFTNKIKNVRWVPHMTSSHLLISKSQFVATVSGTVGLEATLLGKKSLIFGNPWYLGCPGVTKYGESFASRDFLDAPIAEYEEIESWFINDLRKSLVPAFLNKSYNQFLTGTAKFKVEEEYLYDFFKQFFSKLD